MANFQLWWPSRRTQNAPATQSVTTARCVPPQLCTLTTTRAPVAVDPPMVTIR